VIGMDRKLVSSGLAAKQLAKTAPEASPPLDASVFSIVAGLEGHDLNGLRHLVKCYHFSPSFKGLIGER
jgi:hypothetical protein